MSEQQDGGSDAVGADPTLEGVKWNVDMNDDERFFAGSYTVGARATTQFSLEQFSRVKGGLSLDEAQAIVNEIAETALRVYRAKAAGDTREATLEGMRYECIFAAVGAEPPERFSNASVVMTKAGKLFKRGGVWFGRYRVVGYAPVQISLETDDLALAIAKLKEVRAHAHGEMKADPPLTHHTFVAKVSNPRINAWLVKKGRSGPGDWLIGGQQQGQWFGRWRINGGQQQEMALEVEEMELAQAKLGVFVSYAYEEHIRALEQLIESADNGMSLARDEYEQATVEVYEHRSGLPWGIGNDAFPAGCGGQPSDRSASGATYARSDIPRAQQAFMVKQFTMPTVELEKEIQSSSRTEHEATYATFDPTKKPPRHSSQWRAGYLAGLEALEKAVDDGGYDWSVSKIAENLRDEIAHIGPGRAGEWLGKPLRDGMKAGPLMLERCDTGEANYGWRVSVRDEFGDYWPMVRGNAETVDQLTRDWLASLANLEAE